MSDLAVYGPALDASDTEAALLAHLEKWMPTYVPAVVRMKDPDGERWPDGVLPLQEYGLVHAANDNWPEDQLPMLMVYSPGLAEPPIAREDGVDATWLCTVTAYASGVDVDDAKQLGRVYATAAKLAILQHPSLGDFAAGTAWVDEQNFPITRGIEAERTLMAVAAMYAIEVTETLDISKGTLEPPDDPSVEPPDPPLVESGEVAIEIVDEVEPD